MDNNEPTVDSKAHGSIKEWEKYISKNAEAIVGKATAETRIMYDGASERNGGLNTSEVKDRIGACREAYENVGIVGNIIDLMVDFAVEDFTIVHTSPSIQNFYRNWSKKIGLYNVSEQILKSLYRDSNVPILTMRGQLKSGETKKLKKAIAGNDVEPIVARNLLIRDEKSIKKNVIPIAYKILDVLKFDKEGGELLGGTAYKYHLPSEEYKWIKDPKTTQQKDAIVKLEDIYGKKGTKDLATDGYIYLPADRISVLYYKKDGYRKWANPMLWRVIGDVRFKQTLRSMDISVAESVMNTITIIKLGAIEEGLAPSPSAYARFVNLLKIPSKSKTIVWDNLVSMEAEYPPVEKILGSEKYEQVDDDIRSGLGIPEVLVNGGGGNYSNSFLSVKTLLERLETGRTILMAWLNEQIKLVAKAMGFRSLPWVKFRHMSLTDEEAERRIMLELVDRNMMSVQTALDRVGENFEIEVQRMREEDKLRETLREKSEYALLKTGKFGPFIESLADEEEEADMAGPGGKVDPSKQPTNQEKEGDKGGRPNGEKKKQDKQKPSTPKGKSLSSKDLSLDQNDYLAAALKVDLVTDIAVQAVVEHPNKKPNAVEMNRVFDAVIHVLAFTMNQISITEQDIVDALEQKHLTTAPAKLERAVREVVSKSAEKFTQDNKRDPNKKEMKVMTSKAYAICNKAISKKGGK